MTADALLAEFRGLGIDLWADEDRLFWRAPTGVVTGDLFADLCRHRWEILQALESQEKHPSPALHGHCPCSAGAPFTSTRPIGKTTWSAVSFAPRANCAARSSAIGRLLPRFNLRGRRRAAA